MTTNKHPFHYLIGEHLKKHIQNVDFVIDPACGGDQNIPLFLTDVKSNETEICNVDFMMLKNDRIKIILEIEETNIKPTQILGKFMASALAKFYIHKTKKYKKIEMADNVCFIQILTTDPLKPNSDKREQWNKIEKALKEVLPTLKTNIKTYRLFYGGSIDIDLNEITQFIINELEK